MTPRRIFGSNFILSSGHGYLFTRLVANQKVIKGLKESYYIKDTNIVSIQLGMVGWGFSSVAEHQPS